MSLNWGVLGKRTYLALIVVLGFGNNAYSLEPLPEPVEPSTVPKLVLLSPREKIPDKTNYPLPRPPKKYIDGTRLVLANDEDTAPQGPALRDLTDTLTLHQIPAVNKADRRSGKYFWHPFKGWNYCHYHTGNKHWYGWRTGGTFHWILWQEGRFWWRDDDAERWVYFDRGYWWWRGSKGPNPIQVILADGHYHACDGNGVVGDDLMKTGTEETATAPVVKPSPNPTPGGKKGGHHGGHHMGSSMQDSTGGGMAGN